MGKIYVTRRVPESGIEKLKKAGHDVDVRQARRAGIGRREVLD